MDHLEKKRDSGKSNKTKEIVLNILISDLNTKGISVGNIYIINGKIKLIEINYKIFVVFVYFPSDHFKIISSQSNKTLSLSYFQPSKDKNLINPKDTLISNIIDFSKKLKISDSNFLIFTPTYTITAKNQKGERISVKCYKNGYVPPSINTNKNNEKSTISSINIYPLISYDTFNNYLHKDDWTEIKSFHNSLFTDFLTNYHKVDNKYINEKFAELKKCLTILHTLENKPIQDKNDLIVLHSTRKRLIETTSKIAFLLDQLGYYLTFYNFFINFI